MSETRTFTVDEDDDGIRLDRWFKRHLPEVSFNMVSRWSRTGQLRLNGAKAVPGDRIESGQEIRFPAERDLPERQHRSRPAAKPLSGDEEQFIRNMVVYEDPNAFVLNKPPGLATQGGTKTTQHLDRLLSALSDARGRPKLVHRLDKDTSGALLVARTARSAAHFAKAFSGRTARKIYWAIVSGVPDSEEGTIDAPLAKQPGTGGEKMHVDLENGLPSKTRWRVLDKAGNRAAFVELQPFTGRTHQLRAHLAAIGHPIVGDAKYGGPDAFLTGGVSRKLHLHARRIRIDAPDGGKIDIAAELPQHFAETLETLGFDVKTAETPPRSRVPSQQRKVAAAAKARRRERRGERRARGSTGKEKRR